MVHSMLYILWVWTNGWWHVFIITVSYRVFSLPWKSSVLHLFIPLPSPPKSYSKKNSHKNFKWAQNTEINRIKLHEPSTPIEQWFGPPIWASSLVCICGNILKQVPAASHSPHVFRGSAPSEVDSWGCGCHGPRTLWVPSSWRLVSQIYFKLIQSYRKIMIHAINAHLLSANISWAESLHGGQSGVRILPSGVDTGWGRGKHLGDMINKYRNG